MSIRDFARRYPTWRSRIELPDGLDPDFLRPIRSGPCFITAGGSILRPDGEFVFLHTTDFAENILMGKNCFLCGCYPDGVTFNNEHVIPDWLLRYAGISNMSITLPNGHLVRYSSYKVRSCAQCNTFLSASVEGPISKAIKGGFKCFSNFAEEQQKLLFQWLCLLYYKVHFRDFSFRYSVDQREGDMPIGAMYAWPNFHHIFCVARSVIFGAKFSEGVIGSIKVFQMIDWENFGEYDYRDHWLTDTLFIRIRDICIFVSFTDAGAVGYMTNVKFSRVPQQLNYIQATEIFGDFVAAKMHFSQQHKFLSFYNTDLDQLCILVQVSENFVWNDLDHCIRGAAQVFAFGPDFNKFKIEGMSFEETYNEISSGDFSFFPMDGDGKFQPTVLAPLGDLDHLSSLSMRAVNEEAVRNAFRILTKNYYEEE